MTSKKVVSKGHWDKNNEENPFAKVRMYCEEHSTPLHPQQIKLRDDTLKEFADGKARMLGADEVLRLNGSFIKSMAAKKILDVGVFTGASTTYEIE